MRLTDLKLPLAHSADDLRNAILKRLAIAADELVGYTIFRRAYDARKPAAIVFIYTLDVELKNEAAALKRLHGDRHVGKTPDTGYRFVAQVAQTPTALRPERLSAIGQRLSAECREPIAVITLIVQ